MMAPTLPLLLVHFVTVQLYTVFMEFIYLKCLQKHLMGEVHSDPKILNI